MKRSAPTSWQQAATRVLVLALALGAMGSVCPPQRYHAVSLAPIPGRISWDRTVADWTREHKVYHYMDDRIIAHATYHSPAFRKSFIDHRAEFYGHFAEIEDKELVEMYLGQIENFHSFFVSAYVGWQKYRALSRSHTIWTLYLENDVGVKVKAVKFKDVRITPAVQSVYAYADRFDKAYMVRFPLTDAEDRPIITNTTKRFTLHIVSDYAHAELTWQLTPNSSGEADYGMPRDAGLPPDAGTLEDKLGGFGDILGGGL